MLRTVAAKGEGLDEVLAALDRHVRYLEASGELQRRRRQRLREQVVELVEHALRRRLWSDDGTREWLDGELPRVERNETTPFSVADALIARSGNLLVRTTP